MIWVYAGAGVLVLLLGSLAISFDRFVRQRNLINESWANIGTELRRRYDLIPNIVSTIKGYAAHEREIFEQVAAARAAAIAETGPPPAQAATENALVSSVRRLLAVVERYPDLKASENFLALQKELTNTEDRIQAARRFYNANVRAFNTRVESVPSNVIARTFGFTVRDYFEIEEAVRTGGAPSVDIIPDGPTPT